MSVYNLYVCDWCAISVKLALEYTPNGWIGDADGLLCHACRACRSEAVAKTAAARHKINEGKTEPVDNQSDGQSDD